MVNTSDFSKRLQKVLDFYGVSATAFSEEIDFNRSTISHLLSGRNKPSLEFVMKVLQKYPEVELYWLLNGKGSFPSEKKITSAPLQKLDKKEIIDIPSNFSEVKTTTSEKQIERIVVFYRDGSFKAYEN
ncbi:helix-turn-helix domain-containing protein [Ulvibacter antarcticus]|uniref:Helix-turn-helix protein n=1 Tax=Ulvibacter antarcticus TaxID=442714 RepID=A0A3L9Z2F3_9FLAO|nr:helix-turn-helix transcriptional regulator [Ulvibacter antarcticus]RMA64475.1 helix-turn-helix protein [Ulvibacter antarcticus]